MPWLDYNGRTSPLKLFVFVALFVPAVWTAWSYWHGDFGAARPLNEAIHEIGRWTIRLIFLALAVTPLARLWSWPRLLLIRRMVGVAAFAYGAVHLSLYVTQEHFKLATVASEIVLRIYLTIGFTALVILAALAATSTDAMMRRLGRAWARLHKLIYVAAALAVVHHFMQSKADVDEPWVMAGLYGWLMGYRILAAVFGRKTAPLWSVALLSAAAGVLTAIGESLYYWVKLGVSPMRVLAADLALNSIRPGWVVLAVTLAVTAIMAVRLIAAMWTRRPRGGRPAYATVPGAARSWLG
jgi:sulfoxide reductase heme-binding subunit YedZ